jgi:hypothetical protein
MVPRTPDQDRSIIYPSTLISTESRYFMISYKTDDPLANDVAQHWKDNEKDAISTGILKF